MISYNIKNVRQGTPKQIEYNILGSCAVDLLLDGVVVCQLNSIEVRRSKAGKLYIKTPAQQTEKLNDKGYKIEYPYYSLFSDPEMTQWKEQLEQEIFSNFPDTPQRPPVPQRAFPPAPQAQRPAPQPPRASAPMRAPAPPPRTPASQTSSNAPDFDASDLDFEI